MGVLPVVVAVWTLLPVLVHVTEPPSATVAEAGVTVLALMVMAPVEGGGAGGGGGGGGGGAGAAGGGGAGGAAGAVGVASTVTTPPPHLKVALVLPLRQSVAELK